MESVITMLSDRFNRILNAELINITININPLNNIYLVVNPFISVNTLRKMIIKQRYYYISQKYSNQLNALKLFYEQTELSDETKSLIEYGIRNNDSYIKLQIFNPDLVLNLTYKDETYKINVVGNPTITDFKALIKQYIETTEFNPDQHLREISDKDFELYYNNLRLIDNKTVNFYNIINNDVINISCNFINVSVKALNGETYTLKVKEDELTINLKQLISSMSSTYSCPDGFRLLFAGRALEYNSDKTLKTYNIVNNSLIHLVLNLRGGKPVILFYPPKDTKELEVKTVLDLHPECSYTSLLPKPEKEGNRIVWNSIIQNKSDSSDVIVNGRKHKYLFYEFENENSEHISSLIGIQSISNHFNQSYLINGIDEYED